jgi:hypothetical protein
MQLFIGSLANPLRYVPLLKYSSHNKRIQMLSESVPSTIDWLKSTSFRTFVKGLYYSIMG